AGGPGRFRADPPIAANWCQMSDSSNDPVLVEVDGRLATVTLNRPAVLNAMNAGLRQRFVEIVDALERDPAVWVVIVTGAGERAFSAGADLQERNTQSGQTMMDERRISCGRTALARRKTTTAAVHGAAPGGGAELALPGDP